VRGATILADKGVAVIDGTNVVAAIDGDWTDAVLVVLPESRPTRHPIVASDGDGAFLEEVKRAAPHLLDLAERTIRTIRAVGVTGDLRKSKLGRWVNHPLNTFTIKAQPRVGNLHFTLYGDPTTYDAGSFLRKDQNSYSRGWVRDSKDAAMLAKLAREAHERRSS
jgi:hypothetical protein